MALSLDDIETLIKDKKQPPVHDWQPSREDDMDMLIKRDGSWHYQGSAITRESLVRLFSSILRLENDGRYCLVTPAEKLYIQVEDAPFIATGLSLFGESTSVADNKDSVVVFETNVGDRVIVDELHGVRVDTDTAGNPRPYVHVRDGLDALLGRNVYYQLVDACIEYESSIGFWSRGGFQRMGSVDPADSDD